MNIKELREMMQLMREHELVEMEVETKGEKIRLKKESRNQPVLEYVSNSTASGRPNTSNSAGPVPTPVADEEKIPEGNKVRSPMVGTFYSSPSPEQPAFVAVGKMVKAGDVVCIIEAMKLMNEIKVEESGKILEIYLENGQPVEFDQPLFRIGK